jgi:hypothetical protein
MTFTLSGTHQNSLQTDADRMDMEKNVVFFVLQTASWFGWGDTRFGALATSTRHSIEPHLVYLQTSCFASHTVGHFVFDESGLGRFLWFAVWEAVFPDSSNFVDLHAPLDTTRYVFSSNYPPFLDQSRWKLKIIFSCFFFRCSSLLDFVVICLESKPWPNHSCL